MFALLLKSSAVRAVRLACAGALKPYTWIA